MKKTVYIGLIIGAITTVMLASSTIPASVYAQDHCFSTQGEDGDTERDCSIDKEAKDEIKQNKEECKENSDNKCSSSQTGFGEFDNLKKEDYSDP